MYRPFKCKLNYENTLHGCWRYLSSTLQNSSRVNPYQIIGSSITANKEKQDLIKKIPFDCNIVINENKNEIENDL